MSEPSSQQLIDATNMLCRYVAENLEEGWTIRLLMSSDASELELVNPDTDDIEHVDSEQGVSVIESMCKVSHEFFEEDEAE